MKRCRIKISKYAPIFKWLPKYNKYRAVSDIIAGITIGLTVIPQSIAYAALAGLSPQYGLYSSFLGAFLYTIFGFVKEISIGPTSLMAIVTLEFTRGTNPDFAILLTFLAGCIEFIMGVLNLGFLVDFISLPVSSGYTSATAVIIIVSQLKDLLGLEFTASSTIDTLIKIFGNLGNINVLNTLLGIANIIILLSLRKLKDIKLSPDKRRNIIIMKVLWFLSVGRTALVVLICSLISYYLAESGHMPFLLSGNVRPGLPNVAIPNFSTVVNNQTYGFLDMCSHMGSGIIILPLLSILVNVAIVNVYSSGSAVNISHEMRTLGLCNLLGSFVSSMPTAGAFTRSAVSHTSGIQTPFANIYSGVMIILALSFLTPYFYYIPKPTLAAVLISAVIFLLDWRIFHQLWRGSKKDTVAIVGTFIVCIVLNVEAGLLLGIISNIVYLLYFLARPAIKVTECTANMEHKYLLIQPEVSLFFPFVAFMANKVIAIADERAEDNIPVVIDCQRFRSIDYTAVKGLEKLAKDFKDRNQRLWFLNLNHKVMEAIKRLGDLRNLKILKDEAEIVTLLCVIDADSGESVHIVRDETDIPMKNMSASEAEPFLAIDKNNDTVEADNNHVS